jgi:hypothetical protein
MNIRSFIFPLQQVHTLILCLPANGDSSYRDSENMARLMTKRFKSHITILTDKPQRFSRLLSDNVHIYGIYSKKECIYSIDQTVRQLTPGSNLLFLVSAHGYSVPATGIHRDRELNGRTECLHIRNTVLYDYELFDALYNSMSIDTKSLCLIDTCHSGTMLDLEYLSVDGGKVFNRSRQPLIRRPKSVCISACSDSELAGEDISNFGGWGGKLACQYFDFVCKKSATSFNVYEFFTLVYRRFSQQSMQKSRPVISYNE